MYLGERSRNYTLYALLLGIIGGCRQGAITPTSNQRTRLQLESRLGSHNTLFNFYDKIEEARQDIEKILSLDVIKGYYSQNSKLDCYLIGPVKDSKNLYCFKYNDGNQLTVEYYCRCNKEGFERYAKEVWITIKGNPYVQFRFFNTPKGVVNPDEKMEVVINKFKIETKGGTSPKEYKRKILPKNLV